MKITDIKTYLCEGRHDRMRWVFVQVETDEGLVGLGDATNWPHGEVICKAIETYKEFLIGENPFDIERLWKKMYGSLIPFGPGGVQVSAIAGVETACWDIVGKATGQPVYNLIGGKVRDSLRLFAICGAPFRHRPNRSPELDVKGHVEAVEWAVEQGYTAWKYSPKGRPLTREFIRQAREVGLAIRSAMGPDLDISADLGIVHDIDSAIRFANAVGECEPAYMEYHCDDPDTLVKMRQHVQAPLCVGEHQFAREGFRPYFEKRAVDVINVDTVRSGGISETRKIAAMAETFHITVAPHNPNSPVSTLVSGHASIGMSNFIMLEFNAEDCPWRDEVIDPPLRVENGHLILPDRPGIGAELNMKELKKHLITA